MRQFIKCEHYVEPYTKFLAANPEDKESGGVLIEIKVENPIISVDSFDIIQKSTMQPFFVDATKNKTKQPFFIRFLKNSQFIEGDIKGQHTNGYVVAVWEFGNEDDRNDCFRNLMKILK